MAAIGFRAFPDGFSIVVLDGVQSSPTVITSKRFNLPKDYSWCQSLSWVRRQVVETLTKHDPHRCAIKLAEPNSRTMVAKRFQIEGVIFESVFSTANCQCIGLVKTQLKKHITDFSQPARYICHVLDGHAQLEKLNSPNFQDAAIAAIALLPSD